ncbi:FAD-containing monooxygenase EthA domain protein, partial [Mycobacterium ulcerans str. Harvey]
MNLQLFGGAAVTVDGESVDLTKAMAYKGMMLSGLPNMAYTVGYTDASWTLKADLVSEFVCRLLNYMDANDYESVVVERPVRMCRNVHSWSSLGLCAARDRRTSQAGFTQAVATQPELSARYSSDSPRQDRRRGLRFA